MINVCKRSVRGFHSLAADAQPIELFLCPLALTLSGSVDTTDGKALTKRKTA